MFVKSQWKPIRNSGQSPHGHSLFHHHEWMQIVSSTPLSSTLAVRFTEQPPLCWVLSSPSLPQLIPDSKPTEKEAQVITGAVGWYQVKSHYKSPWAALKFFPRTRRLLSETLPRLGVFSSHRCHSNRNRHTALFNHSIFMGLVNTYFFSVFSSV